MKNRLFEKAAVRRHSVIILAVFMVAAFALTYLMWPRPTSPFVPLFTAALPLIIWLYFTRRRAEALVRRQARQLGAVVELGQHVLSGVNVAELMKVAVSVVARRTGAESAALWEVLPGGWFMSVRASVGWTKAFLKDATVDLSKDSMLSCALDSAEPVVITQHTSEPRLVEPPHIRREARSCVSVAVRGRAGSFGVLSVYTDERSGFTEGDVSFIQAVAHILSSVVVREQIEAERSRPLRYSA